METATGGYVPATGGYVPEQEVMCRQQEFHAAVILKLRRLYRYEAVPYSSEAVI